MALGEEWEGKKRASVNEIGRKNQIGDNIQMKLENGGKNQISSRPQYANEVNMQKDKIRGKNQISSMRQYANEVNMRKSKLVQNDNIQMKIISRTYPQKRPARIHVAKNRESPNSVFVGGAEMAKTTMKKTACSERAAMIAN